METLENNIEMFVAKHQAEKGLLPLCILSSNINKEFKHNREIFNDFNKFNDKERKEILKHFNVDFKYSLKGNWIEDGIKIIIDFIKENDLHNGNDKYLLFDFKKYIQILR